MPATRPRRHQPTSAASTRKPAKKEEAKPLAGTIPDATHKPVVTNRQRDDRRSARELRAETGMLPLLKSDGTLRASIFYVAYTKQGGRMPAAGDVLLQRRAGGGLGVAAPGRAGAAPRAIERKGPRPARAAGPGGQPVLDSRTLPTWCSSIRWAPASVTRQGKAKPSSSSASRPTSRRWANLFSSGRRGMSAGFRRNTFAAKVTACIAPPDWRITCTIVTAWG